MSAGEEDRIERYVALEKTYVHDVYDHMSALQYAEQRNTAPWPKVKKFLNELEPGSIVCDVGCGSGKYLKVNPSVYKVGSDRCHNLTQIAKEDDNEVLLCDNLTLPFRDESFDAVLSIAVIHHFTTTERRVCALKELTRVLRIGGKMMITVWAMEQKDRRFEAQDVLVQWHCPQSIRSPSFEFSTTATATSEEDFVLPCRISQSHVSDDNDSFFSRSSSFRHDNRSGKSRLRLFQSLRSIKTSPSSSSLSSPNETCYSFVKKALQKLSRSNKKEKHQSRAWFLDSWTSFGKDDHLPATRYDPEGCEEDTNLQDLPIELRRMEKETQHSHIRLATAAVTTALNKHHRANALTQKSKSLNDILFSSLNTSPFTRSRSSIVAAEGRAAELEDEKIDDFDTLKPKLVKQKKSICEDDFDVEEDRDKATDMRKLIGDLPIFKVSLEKPTEKYNVLKQKSLTEDIMSSERLKERESVRQNIQKQASLNEDLIYRRHQTTDSIKDTFFSSSSKKFHMFRSGLTNKLKNSTTNIEKMTVAGASIKSGFARIFQGLTGGESVAAPSTGGNDNGSGGIELTQSTYIIQHPTLRKSSSEDYGDNFGIERRFSHEENSDSSKDNSLQSDTSIDSEDSIISVIERIKPESSTSPTTLTSPGPLHSPKMALAGVLSHPSSPKISQVMQYPSSVTKKSLSLPASPRIIVLSPNIKQTFKLAPMAPFGTTPNGNGHGDGNGSYLRDLKPSDDEPVFKLSPIEQVTAAKVKSLGNKEMLLLSQKLNVLRSKETEPRGDDVCEGDESQKSSEHPLFLQTVGEERRKSIGESVQTKFAEEPVKKTATIEHALKKVSSNNIHALNTRHHSRSHSYEIFNPETEDIDTDSSGVSTPDSVGSVISVKMDSSTGTPVAETAQTELYDTKTVTIVTTQSNKCSISSLPVTEPSVSKHKANDTDDKVTFTSTCTDADESSSASLVIAPIVRSQPSESVTVSTAPRANTLLFRGKPSSTSVKSTAKLEELDPSDHSNTVENRILKKYSSILRSPIEHDDASWDKECRQHLVDLAESLSERLQAEMDRYRGRNINVENESSNFTLDDVEDPYLSRLAEELSHVSKLTRELSSDLETIKPPERSSAVDETRCNPTVAEETTRTNKLRFTDTNVSERRASASGSFYHHHRTSGEIESPEIISSWLDSRRNTIELSNVRRADRICDDNRTLFVTTKGAEAKIEDVIATGEYRKPSKSESLNTRLSVESTDTVDGSERISSSDDSVSKKDATQPESSASLSAECESYELEKIGRGTISNGSQASLLRPGESIESSEAGTISSRTGSVSDFSRQNTESRSVITQSSASLASWSDCSRDIRFADRRTARCDGRSSSEETNSRAILTRQAASTREPLEMKTESIDTSISRTTSQDSLSSERGDGAITYHRYYHVFRENELNSLIHDFLGNLHVISSFYDHTNWCIIAEKVRVWTI